MVRRREIESGGIQTEKRLCVLHKVGFCFFPSRLLSFFRSLYPLRFCYQPLPALFSCFNTTSRINSHPLIISCHYHTKLRAPTCTHTNNTQPDQSIPSQLIYPLFPLPPALHDGARALERDEELRDDDGQRHPRPDPLVGEGRLPPARVEAGADGEAWAKCDVNVRRGQKRIGVSPSDRFVDKSIDRAADQSTRAAHGPIQSAHPSRRGTPCRGSCGALSSN